MGIRISSSNIVQSDSQNVKEEFRKPSERKLYLSFQKRARWIFPYNVRGDGGECGFTDMYRKVYKIFKFYRIIPLNYFLLRLNIYSYWKQIIYNTDNRQNGVNSTILS